MQITTYHVRQRPEVTLSTDEVSLLQRSRSVLAMVFRLRPDAWAECENPEGLDAILEGVIETFEPGAEQDDEPGGAEPEEPPRKA